MPVTANSCGSSEPCTAQPAANLAPAGIMNMAVVSGSRFMETCYKLFRREVIQGLTIEEDRFGFEPEITAKIAHRGLTIYEVGISYYGRTYAEGKKIGWKDGVRAVYAIIKYNVFKRSSPRPSK